VKHSLFGKINIAHTKIYRNIYAIYMNLIPEAMTHGFNLGVLIHGKRVTQPAANILAFWQAVKSITVFHKI